MAPGPRRHGLLHEVATRPHRPRRVGERQRARGDQRRVLAERVPGDERRRRTAARSPRRRARRWTRRGWPAGCCAVSFSSSSGPSKHSRESFSPSASSTASNTWREPRGRRRTGPCPCPTAWLPCPGKTKRRLLIAPYQRTTPAPQAIPAPMAIIAMTSPGLSLPARFASSSVVGSERRRGVAVLVRGSPSTSRAGSSEPLAAPLRGCGGWPGGAMTWVHVGGA